MTMTRTTFIALAALIAAPAYAQITFRASSLDIEQNERLDDVESRVESIEQSVGRIEGAVTQMLSDQAMALTVKPKPKAEPEPTVRESRTVQVTARPASNRYTQAELVSIVRSRYPKGFRAYYADVSPRSAVWSHLKSGTHGFSSAQVDGMSQAIALGLHDMEHGGLITPSRGRSQVGTSAPVRPAASVIQSSGTGCASGQCARQTTGTVQRSRIFPRPFRRR